MSFRSFHSFYGLRFLGRAKNLSCLLWILAAGHPSCLAPRQTGGPQRPAGALSQTYPQPEGSSPESYDEPDGARQYYLMKRSYPDGKPADLVNEYRRASGRMERMPRYSTRAGKALPSLSETREGKNTPELALPGLLSTWEFVGPGNIGGRTRALLIDPANPEIIYAAGVSGGIWKTSNGGASWIPLGDLLPNIAVNSMAMDPADSRIIYAGTGEGYFREIVRGTGLPLRGEGVLKTVDGGATWERLQETSNPDFYWVNDLAISRSDPRRIYAATRTGIWRSANAGRNWRRILNAEAVTGGCLDLALRVDLPDDYLLAACGTFQQATVYLNSEAQLDGPWMPVLSEYGMGRTSLAIAPSNPDIVYALSASYVPGPGGVFNGGLHAVFRSDQGGAPGSWRATVRNTDSTKLNTLLLTNPLAAFYRACGVATSDSYSTLGWYTNVIAVDPMNPDIVFAGGVDLFRSDDGGFNWGPVSHWAESPPSAHADQHVIVFHPGYDGEDNQTLYLGGDGGVWRTDNARAFRSVASNAPCTRNSSHVLWTSLNHNYGVTQFYHGTPSPDGSFYLGGTQDNGTILGSGLFGSDGWIRILGGDGGYVAVDPVNPSIIYAESQNLSLRKSVNGGRSFTAATQGIAEPGGGTLFIAPFVMDPNDSRRLWFGGRSIWRTGDGAANWTAAGQRLSETAKVSAIAVAPSDSNRVLVGMNDGFIYRQDQATLSDSSSTWPSSRPRPGFVTWLAFDPADPQVAYATYADFGGRHVWKSADGGETWISLDGEGTAGLPDIPVHALVVDPNHRQHLYLATDMGIFTSRQGGNVWAVENSGFANAVTESLTLQQRPGKTPVLWAFTHGRGAWRVPLSSPPVLPCSPDRWIPHVTPAGTPYETVLIATNFAKQESQVELIPYLEDGTPLRPVSLRVRPGATPMSSAQTLFQSQPVSHFGVCGSSSVSITAAYRSTAGLSASAHVPEISVRGREFLIYPGEWDAIFDGMSLINLGEEESRVEAILQGEDGGEMRRIVLNPALAPGARHLAVLDQEFRGLRGSAIRIVSSRPSTILFLRGTHANANPALLYQIVPVVDAGDSAPVAGPCSPQRWILHVTPPGSGYETTISATNLGGAGAGLELIPFKVDGSRLNPVSMNASSGQTLISAASNLFSGAAVSHFGVCGAQALRVASAFRALSGQSVSAHVPETSLADTRFLFYPGEAQVVYEGMAVVNRSTEPSRVEAVLLDTDGDEVRRAVLIDSLAPGAKHLAVLSAVFDGFSGIAVRIECGEPSSILLLRGTHPAYQPGILFQTVPIAVTPRR